MTPAEYLEPRRLFRMVLVTILSIVAIYAETAPLGLGPNAPPSPDLLLCVMIYWSIRRPGSVPMILIFALGLMRDLLTDVPVGAGALSLVLVTEAFKTWRRYLARSNFLVEWMAAGAAALLGTAFVWLLVMLTLAQPPYVMSVLHQCLYTAMIYPVFVLVLRWGLGIGWRRVEAAV